MCERGPVMKDVYARLQEDFDLRGLSVRSRKAYLGAVRQLGKHCGRALDKLGDEEVRGYFLHLIDGMFKGLEERLRDIFKLKFGEADGEPEGAAAASSR